GIFSLRQGERVESKRNNRTVYHNLYYTAIACTSATRIQAQLRVYSPPGDEPLPDDTIVLTIAQVIFSAGADAFMDALHVLLFPGDPTSNNHQVCFQITFELHFPTII
ncbi:hypothetical protein DFH07DRAFT_721006, partial [Mycena maculata]